MEYEAYEPNPEDEYYDQMCRAAMTRMFGGDSYETAGVHHSEFNCGLYGCDGNSNVYHPAA